MKLPNANEAVIERAKIEDYALSPTHPRGKHKAIAFRQTLGIEREDADALISLILGEIRDADCIEAGSDQFGRRYTADLAISWRGRSALSARGGSCA